MGDLSSPFPSNIHIIIIFCSARWSVSIACQMGIYYSVAVVVEGVPTFLSFAISLYLQSFDRNRRYPKEKCILFKFISKFIRFVKFPKTIHVQNRLTSISPAEFFGLVTELKVCRLPCFTVYLWILRTWGMLRSSGMICYRTQVKKSYPFAPWWTQYIFFD